MNVATRSRLSRALHTAGWRPALPGLSSLHCKVNRVALNLRPCGSPACAHAGAECVATDISLRDLMCRPHQTPSAPHRTPFCTRGKPRLREEETCQGHTRGRGTAVARAPGRPPGSGRPPHSVCGPARGGRQCPRLPSLASWPRRICVRGETQKRLERRRGPASGRLRPSGTCPGLACRRPRDLPDT